MAHIPQKPLVKRRKGKDTNIRERAEELAATGMPFQMAMAVASGRLQLNDALERMVQQDQVKRLMERHDLSRALATQIAMGHADLDTVLARRRMEEHREQNRSRSKVVEASVTKVPVVLGLHGKRRITAVIDSVDSYTFQVIPEKGEVEEIHKLQLKYICGVDDYKQLRKVLRTNKALSKNPLEPVEKPQDRYSCGDRRLFQYLDRGKEVEITLLEGEIIRGVVVWFSRFEFCLRVRSRANVVILRHALHNLTS
ncbi:MAG: hypothetical protein HN348_01095 [Proteobacteria bacterium]|nr:hypothetical protein [Pseudomonadota bacterium]